MTTTTPAVTVTLAEAEASGFAIPARVTAPPRFTERHPWLFPVAVRVHRVRRRLRWWASAARWASVREPRQLPVRVKAHGSLLMRELSAEEMVLQRNKVVNLRLAAARVHTLLIRPGETFSFNKAVGNCTRRKGYVEGMRLSNGAAIAGVGGGICQLANLLHWMFLHADLTILERSEHSFAPFPDKGRVLPWGVGCSIVYNYVDLVVRNDTDRTFQLRVWLTDRHLRGELRADAAPAYSYRVEARAEAFLEHRGRIYRKNEIWRTRIDRTTGVAVGEELMKRNCALVTYQPEHADVVRVEG